MSEKGRGQATDSPLSQLTGTPSGCVCVCVCVGGRGGVRHAPWVSIKQHLAVSTDDIGARDTPPPSPPGMNCGESRVVHRFPGDASPNPQTGGPTAPIEGANKRQTEGATTLRDRGRQDRPPPPPPLVNCISEEPSSRGGGVGPSASI